MAYGQRLASLLSVPAPKPIIPEVIEPDEKLPRDLVALRKFAYLMDEAVPVPGTRRRVGLDAGLSLIPGFGEAIGAFLSACIIFGALRHRVPTARVARMVFYVLIDTVLGAIPVVGTIFDWLFEENVMNINALLLYRDRTRPPRSTGSILGVAIFICVILTIAAVVVMTGPFVAIIWLANQR
jgi:hypothetical protein